MICLGLGEVGSVWENKVTDFEPDTVKVPAAAHACLLQSILCCWSRHYL